MQYLLDLLRSHGPLLVMAVAFLETLGVPLPAFPFFVLTGCLIAEGSQIWPLTLVAGVAGTVSGDLLWFLLGRRMGRRALNLLCRLSINPEACVGRSEKLFQNRSTITILTAKLVPGLNTLIPSLAGIMGLRLLRYAALDAVGSFLWAGTGLALGLAFGTKVLTHLEGVQHTLFLLMVVMFGFYIVFRIGYRLYLAKRYSVPRIDAEELRRKLASDGNAVVVDLRSDSAYSDSSWTIPDAIRISPTEFDKHVDLLPAEKSIVFFCT